MVTKSSKISVKNRVTPRKLRNNVRASVAIRDMRRILILVENQVKVTHPNGISMGDDEILVVRISVKDTFHLLQYRKAHIKPP
ncbi:MAG: hypothetical protein R2795_07315 [Saprospiraceae bacterium]